MTDIATALLEADRLSDQHRALEAIDRLQAAYHDDPDPRLARRLVELRHQAFDELPKGALPGEWPPVRPNCVAHTDADGVARIVPAQLNGELLGSALVTHGCLRVDGLLDAGTVERLRDRIAHAFDARQRVAEGEPIESAAPWYVPYAPGRAKAEGFGRDQFVRVADVPEAMCDLVEVFTATGVRTAVEDYLGERPAMIANKWVLRRSDGGVLLGDFHQDGAFLGEGIRTVDCWIALSDCGPGTGVPAIDIVPQRIDRILPTGGESAFAWAVAETAVAGELPGAAIASPVFAAGDALFFDERLVHRTSVGVDLGVRYAIESWFVAPSSYPSKHLPIVL